MKLTRLELAQFTAFEHAVFDFVPGVNVLIGENGTGKSHALKLIYCLSEAFRQVALAANEEPPRLAELRAHLITELVEVFQPAKLAHLIRLGARRARLHATWSSGDQRLVVEVVLTHDAFTLEQTGEAARPVAYATFVPSREVLSLLPGFFAAYARRETTLDRTFADLCMALGENPLADDRSMELRDRIAAVLGGQLENDRGHFHLQLAEGRLEIALLSEGLRKLAMLDYLLLNGRIAPGGALLWSEPEAGVGPRLIKLLAEIALGLARDDVQIWITTHDHLLTSELALQTRATTGEIAFFSLHGAPPEATTVERGDRLADLQHNSIRDAVAELDR